MVLRRNGLGNPVRPGNIFHGTSSVGDLRDFKYPIQTEEFNHIILIHPHVKGRFNQFDLKLVFKSEFSTKHHLLAFVDDFFVLIC